ncbi:ATP-binding cassette domain-containing protein [Phytoactinopolyspora halotolerans]|uniref:ATP-binding cassette domain-containing protein n=1 Tax=Phytoactinopolyspora halotolerans TaxID=1981512 RepID=A0A6L9S1C0_9ACTN|nr:ATP-binding cassette domain-containing protein [Phytoactinopolyspora halotolerans]NED98796.1 ATP-binding cassette domain-containing protein [Phytoactinopolyspora halotolerans]
MIHAQNLTRRFQLKNETVEAVRGIDIDIAPGEIVAFLGPNGAGKSTTLRMLTTLLPPSDGTATVAGFDVRRDPVEVRRRIGHIGQGNGSFDGLRVSEELYTQGRFYGLDRGTARARAAELLDQLDLSEQAERDVARLSGGQRRRLDIAMGLIHRPGLVFLDEPSSGLDPQSRANLLDHIRRLHRDEDVTIVLTTHYLDEADAVAERVIVIDHGTIIADGTPDQLKSKVSGDLITVTLQDPGQASAAVDVAHRIPTAHEIQPQSDGVAFRVEHGDIAMPELVRALDRAGLAMSGVQVQRPTLDDVFLNLTGRSLREED